MEVRAFPTPQLKGGNMAGLIVGVDVVSGSKPGRGFLYQGPMEENESMEIEFMTNNIAAGMYLVTVWFKECGFNQGGEGKHVFKVVII